MKCFILMPCLCKYFPSAENQQTTIGGGKKKGSGFATVSSAYRVREQNKILSLSTHKTLLAKLTKNIDWNLTLFFSESENNLLRER